MRILHRWTASIVSGFEHVVSRVENHEAIVASAIRQTRESAAGARVKLNRVRRDGERLRERLVELQRAEENWTARALKTKETDEQKALECLRRRKSIQKEITHLQTELTRHEELERRLARDVDAVAERVADLTRRKNAFSARQFRARALEIGETCLSEPSGDLEEIFDRWETKLAETEPILCADTDSLESTFLAEEEKESLRAELEKLADNHRA